MSSSKKNYRKKPKKVEKGALHAKNFEILKCGMELLHERVDSFDQKLHNLENLHIEIPQNSKDRPKIIMQKIRSFYNDFQEAYDLYLFVYLGRFLRSTHYDGQPVFQKHKNMRPYQVKKEGNNISSFWCYCLAYFT